MTGRLDIVEGPVRSVVDFTNWRQPGQYVVGRVIDRPPDSFPVIDDGEEAVLELPTAVSERSATISKQAGVFLKDLAELDLPAAAESLPPVPDDASSIRDFELVNART